VTLRSEGGKDLIGPKEFPSLEGGKDLIGPKEFPSLEGSGVG